MNINKLNLEVAKAASKEVTRYHLNSIHFTPEYTESTDGHVLARVTYPVQFDPEELPAMIKTDHKEKIKPFIIPMKSAKEIKIPKGRVSLPVLADAYVDVEATNNNGIAKFSMTDLETTPVTEVRKIDGEFPDTSQVWPKDEKAVFEFDVDPAYLKLMADIASGFGKHCTLTFYGLNSAMKIKSDNFDTYQQFTGLIMPMMGDAREFEKEDYSRYLADLEKNNDWSSIIHPWERTAKSIWKSMRHFQRLAKRLIK